MSGRSTHGRSKNDPTYRSWSAMLTRCYNRNRDTWFYYGGRGILVCDCWKTNFEKFLADMGPRPVGTTLDRWPNPNGNYEPGNCRWATKKEQATNRKSSKITSDVAKEILGRFEYGESRQSIATRLKVSTSTVVRVINGRHDNCWPELDRPWMTSPDHGVVRERIRDHSLNKRIVKSRGKSAALYAKEHGVTLVAAAELFGLTYKSVRNQWPKLHGDEVTPEQAARAARLKMVVSLAKEGLCATEIATRSGLSVRAVCDIRDRYELSMADGRK